MCLKDTLAAGCMKNNPCGLCHDLKSSLCSSGVLLSHLEQFEFTISAISAGHIREEKQFSRWLCVFHGSDVVANRVIPMVIQSHWVKCANGAVLLLVLSSIQSRWEIRCRVICLQHETSPWCLTDRFHPSNTDLILTKLFYSYLLLISLVELLLNAASVSYSSQLAFSIPQASSVVWVVLWLTECLEEEILSPV